MFLINIILFIICMGIYKMENIMGFNTFLIYMMLLVVFIICLIDLIKNKKHANYDNKYNYIFIVSNIIITLIILRGLFDTSIVTNSYDTIDSGYRMFFVGNNLIYFNAMYLCLIIYRFTIKKQKTAK